MYANELQPRVGKLTLTADKLEHGKNSVPVADAVATVDDSGKQWAIALINRHPDQPLNCTVRFKDQPLNGAFDAVVLAGDSPEAFNDVEHPNRVVPVKRSFTLANGVAQLPPHSITILKVANSAAK